MAIKMVRLQVLEITSDRQQYKPYSHKLGAPSLFVEVPVDDGEVVEFGKDKIVITLDGFAGILGSVADSIESMHLEYRKHTTGY